MPSAFSTGLCHAAVGAATHLRATPVLKALPRRACRLFVARFAAHFVKPGTIAFFAARLRPGLITAIRRPFPSVFWVAKSATVLNQLSSRFSKINLYRAELNLLQMPDFQAISHLSLLQRSDPITSGILNAVAYTQL
ncbi:hypothetical protein [Paraburkholderia fungorum]|jgi:hypothetical protein|uniref:hypothetical protein n=1 Tax=Paraburkholderia fungorum TaxID=134537 RepID=UPI001614ACA0|nr:hypothetical protein [Paraburkholderia fungorum]MBB4512757.1 hypothetical protein [Paraburkholderia fungorum]